jgi:demethylspheroidene O-methyltransferase
MSGAAGWKRGGWINRLVARPGFQAWAARFPLTRRQARADGEALFELVQGFVSAQVLRALVELDIFQRLRAGPETPDHLAAACDVPSARMAILLQAGAALGLLKKGRKGRLGLARKGAAILGVPGLAAMIRHHDAFYDDMRDPVALLRGEGDTRLSSFWPYVFGGDIPAHEAEVYSDLMAQSQKLVAQDTLDAVALGGVKHLMDIGGGTGAFVEAAAHRAADTAFTLYDLPQVVPGATARFAAAGISDRVRIVPGSFREDATLPHGADAISLVRVLYDHADDTVTDLLAKVYAALPPDGRLIVSEPMAGDARPERAGDVYFAFYTMAMQTGRARSAREISELCAAAGFEQIRSPKPRRPFVTRVLTAQKPLNV